MKLIALVSGGKDSILSIIQSVILSHEIACIANLCPDEGLEEIDSFCFQTVGHCAVKDIAYCFKIPLVTATIKAGQSLNTEMIYKTSKPGDEVEEMFTLLQSIKKKYPDCRGICSGAILSNYQRLRVENVCARLGLTSIAPLWHMSGDLVLSLIQQLRIEAVLIKVASMGLNPRKHLGKPIPVSLMLELEESYHVHPAGEGGEYETIVLDCPLFETSRLKSTSSRLVITDDNTIAPCGRLELTTEVVEKTEEERNVAQQWRDDVGRLKTKYVDELEFHALEPHLRPRALLEGVRECHQIDAVVVSLEDSLKAAESRGLTVRTFSVSSGVSLLSKLKLLLQESVEVAVREQLRIAFILICAPDMSCFSEFNTLYCEYLQGVSNDLCDKGILICAESWPSRAFVGHGLAQHVKLQVSYIPTQCTTYGAFQVQSLSYWAAPCIGPYSQATWFDDPSGRTIFLSGFIGIHPYDASPAVNESNVLNDEFSNFATQFCFAICNVISVLTVVIPYKHHDRWLESGTTAAKLLFCNNVSTTIYITQKYHGNFAASLWKWIAHKAGYNSIIKLPQVVLVNSLPKNVLVEILVHAEAIN